MRSQYNHRYLLVEPLSRCITRAEFHLTQNRVNFTSNTMNVVRTLHSLEIHKKKKWQKSVCFCEDGKDQQILFVFFYCVY